MSASGTRTEPPAEPLQALHGGLSWRGWKLPFEKNGRKTATAAEGKCIEVRELIIALPEVYTQYEPQQVLEDFTEEFHKRYGVECISALHHNKRKTKYPKGWINCPIRSKRTVTPMCRRLWRLTEKPKPL